ncbi:uncharacterized [Tachysurus ichikawai]
MSNLNHYRSRKKLSKLPECQNAVLFFQCIHPAALCLDSSSFINICYELRLQADGGGGESMGLIGCAALEMEGSSAASSTLTPGSRPLGLIKALESRQGGVQLYMIHSDRHFAGLSTCYIQAPITSQSHCSLAEQQMGFDLDLAVLNVKVSQPCLCRANAKRAQPLTRLNLQ